MRTLERWLFPDTFTPQIADALKSILIAFGLSNEILQPNMGPFLHSHDWRNEGGTTMDGLELDVAHLLHEGTRGAFIRKQWHLDLARFIGRGRDRC